MKLWFECSEYRTQSHNLLNIPVCKLAVIGHLRQLANIFGTAVYQRGKETL
jgi:hypothetical protein